LKDFLMEIIEKDLRQEDSRLKPNNRKAI